MVEVQNPTTKKFLIEQIMLDINEVPIAYLKTLQAIIHSFKENIAIIPNEPTPKETAEGIGNVDDFDWDNLLEDIHTQRQNNNTPKHLWSIA